MARKDVTEIDVSDVDDRGRFVNRDIPEDERKSGRSSGTSSSSAKKRLQKKQADAQKRNQENKEALEESEAPAKSRKRRSKKNAESSSSSKKDTSSNSRSTAASATKSSSQRKKRRKKTVGEHLANGDTDKAERKKNRLSTGLVKVSEQNDIVSSEGSYEQSGRNQEADFLNEYQHIYDTLGRIMRTLEYRLTDTKDFNSRDVYALSTLYSQMRETIADIRSIKDMEQQAEELAEQVFDPAAKSSGDALVSLYYNISAQVRQKVSDPAEVEAVLTSIKDCVGTQAGQLQTNFDSARSRILDVLNGGR